MATSTVYDVPLTDEDEAMMIATGFAVRTADGALELTEQACTFILDWCRRHGR